MSLQALMALPDVGNSFGRSTGVTPRSWFARRLLVTAVALLPFAGWVRSGIAAETISLEIVRTAIREHVSSITSISMKYKVYYKHPKGARHPSGAGVESWGPRQCEWAEQGAQKLLKSGPIPIEGGQGSGGWMCHDGQAGFQVVVDQNDPSKVLRIMKTPLISPFYYLHFPSPPEFSALRLPHSDEQLVDLLSRSEAKAVGIEIIGGEPCWRVRVGTLRGRDNYLMELTVTFDPAHGYLPRHLSVRPSKNDERYDEMLKGGFKMDFEVLAFQRIWDPLLGRERWFPREGRRYNSEAEYRFVIDEILINAPIPAERFQAPLQFGTEVTEGPPKPGESAVQYVIGGARAVDALIANRVEESRRLNYPVDKSSELLDARDRGGIFSYRLLFWMSLAVVAVTFCGRVVLRRKARSL